jgi:phosphoglycolate phosphatase
VLVTFGPEGQGIARLDPDALLHQFDDLPALAAKLLG